MPFAPPPHAAAWRHHTAREGFEVVFFDLATSGMTLRGTTAAVEDGTAWSVAYEITVDPDGASRRAVIRAATAAGHRGRLLEADGVARWRVDGVRRPDLDGCLDVDLESSACTNLLPVRRMRLGVGDSADAPAAYVRAIDLTVERLEQHYYRVDDDGRLHAYDYAAPRFDFADRLLYDRSGLVTEYPGIASRVM